MKFNIEIAVFLRICFLNFYIHLVSISICVWSLYRYNKTWYGSDCKISSFSHFQQKAIKAVKARNLLECKRFLFSDHNNFNIE